MLIQIFLLILTVFILLIQSDGKCGQNCNKNGVCNQYGTCECFEGYTGPACAERTCPTGTAWVDAASAVDIAHAQVECSNMVCYLSNIAFRESNILPFVVF